MRFDSVLDPGNLPAYACADTVPGTSDSIAIDFLSRKQQIHPASQIDDALDDE